MVHSHRVLTVGVQRSRRVYSAVQMHHLPTVRELKDDVTYFAAQLQCVLTVGAVETGVIYLWYVCTV